MKVTGLLLCCFLSACSTLPNNQILLNDVLKDPRVMSLTFAKESSGLILLDNVQLGDTKLRLLLDTGATRSAIFEKHINRLNLESAPRRVVNVYGLAGVAQRDIVTVPVLQMGSQIFTDVDFVILPDRAKQTVFRQTDVAMDGLIGMDVLDDYTLHISRETSQITFIPKDISIRIPRSLSKIDLQENPFIDDDRGLHFFKIEILGDEVATLFDTGAEINVMNWNDVRSRRLKAWYRDTRQNWEVQGAVGVFDPKLKIRMSSLGSGPVTWREKDFIVMDVPSLDILGIGEATFMVAGFNLLEHDEILIDFERNVLAVKTSRRHNFNQTLRALENTQEF